MSQSLSSPLLPTLPKGWLVHALHGRYGESPLCLGPLKRSDSDESEPGRSTFLVLRTLPEATVYLGCLTDQSGRVHEWLEIWRENVVTDDHSWQELVDSMRSLTDGREIQADWSWESESDASDGRVMVRKYATFDMAQFSELVSRAAIKEPVLESKVLAAVCAPTVVSTEDRVRFGEGFYLLSRRGSAGLFGESLYLKLNILSRILDLCEKVTQSTRRPFLNLSTRSFGIDIQSTAGLLPAAWTAQTVLRHPGARVARFLEMDAATYFAFPSDGVHSIYQPRDVKPSVNGSGTVRLRKVDRHGDKLLIEGTLASNEPLMEDGLLELYLELPSGRVLLRAHLSSGGAGGECRFVSSVKLDADHCAHLADPLQLAPFPNTAFSIRPPVSSACDLYSIAVVGIELLFVDEEQSLSVALDEMVALGNHLHGQPTSEDIVLLMDAAMHGTPSWRQTLGPQRLIQEVGGRPFSYEEALSYVPPEIWWNTVYLLLRMLTMGWKFNHCKHLNDVPSLAQHAVYRQPMARLEVTLDQLRSLLLLDWNLNQEVRSLVDARLGVRSN